ncbi:TetR/AcrR family transcriptional regulator [Clostridium sp. Marseille-P2415]|uniref:TetR/AcrR family transcriptional regulator n=1 Tax=Clostridium sp. Marseille-P2415 TaxID=1805471 RepID=UPI00098848CC|nr:TetR/AcrR family transcriptional regulator [Clostridium sp. Marseille-P2415]
MEKREDLRTLKSKRLMKNTFLELIKEKGYQHITVMDISRRALINRKTFYFHYETIEALYEEMTNEYLHLLDFSVLLPTLQIDLRHSDFLTKATFVLEKIKEQKEPFQIMMNDPTNNRFNEKLKHFLSLFLTDTMKLNDYAAAKTLPGPLIQNIYSSIFFEIIKWWIDQNDIPAERAIALMLSMFSDNMLDALGIRIIS